ncbi:hypothetical protein [Planctomicrobium piriforme]|uniref:Uncharacterized protein n=1 Tax=Planctomicrobium piriforme TaxID=1576369 RepID=A0A1I3M0K9_9PLAN|nr:hypothetical protein [Planctomicrobium piriforme]SFI90559.1 hypothetical protein SAMN05421753_113125 [Planctomicrobium piriforme]
MCPSHSLPNQFLALPVFASLSHILRASDVNVRDFGAASGCIVKDHEAS